MTTVKITAEVGRFIAGSIKRALEEYLFQNAATYHIEERKGFPITTFLIEFTAKDDKAKEIVDDLKAFGERAAREL